MKLLRDGRESVTETETDRDRVIPLRAQPGFSEQWRHRRALDEPDFDHSSFGRNRGRLPEHDVAGEFFHTVVAEARELKLTSDEHFTVDGTLIEAWASLKSLRPKGEEPSDRTPPDDPGNPSVDFHGERRQNATHQSTTDPEARLAKKGAGKEARLCYTESVLMENRNGIMIDLRMGQASGRAECEQGLEMLQEIRGPRRITVAGDKGYDTAAFVASCRALNVTPHVAQNERRPGGSALDVRTTSRPGYAVLARRAALLALLPNGVRNSVTHLAGLKCYLCLRSHNHGAEFNLKESLQMPEVVLCKDCKQSINKEVDQYVILEKGTDRYPEVLAHVACEQKRAAGGLGLDEWLRKLRWPNR